MFGKWLTQEAIFNQLCIVLKDCGYKMDELNCKQFKLKREAMYNSGL